MKPSNYEHFTTHLASIVKMYEAADRKYDSISDADAHGIIARIEGAIQKICSDDSPYRKRMEMILDDHSVVTYKLDIAIGIVRALKSDLEDGYLESFSELVRGELFEDFIEMADYLLSEGYKDAAAVIAGSALEAHLRQLCVKNGMSLTYAASDGATKHLRAEQMNQNLGKSVYSLFDQKQITAWFDLRNDAAHGNYSNFTIIQVGRLIEWIRDFIAKNPA